MVLRSPALLVLSSLRGIAGLGGPARLLRCRAPVLCAPPPADNDASTGEWQPPPGFKEWVDDGDLPPGVGEDEADDRVGARADRLDPPPSPLTAVLEMAAGYCTGCGVPLQAVAAEAPGYVPPSVLESRGAIAEERDRGKTYLRPRVDALICQRCHGLRYANRLPNEVLRVGDEEATPDELRPEHFLGMLRTLRAKRCIVVVIVDLFDFHGSLVPNLRQIVADGSPLLMVGNKVDLLPAGVSLPAVELWVRSECRKARVPQEHSLNLVSCRTGAGIKPLLAQLRNMMAARRMDAYVLGAANAGKSSFINHALSFGSKGAKKRGGGAAAAAAASLTTSHLPGTTLGFVKASLLSGRQALYDTPGVVLPNQLTTLLTTSELADVVPKKRSSHVTLKLGEGKSVLVGGLARIHVVRGRPFYFTFHLANAVTIHPTATEKVSGVLDEHIGSLLSPPASAERLAEMGEFERQHFELEGRGWNDAAADIVLPGLGWVAVTGSGDIGVVVEVPRPVRVFTREPLLQTSAKRSSVKFDGSVLRDKRGAIKRMSRSGRKRRQRSG